MKKMVQPMTRRDKAKDNSKKPGRPGAAVTLARGESDLGFNLHPGLRERIISEMDGAKIPQDRRTHYLSMLTGRAIQTARRWIDEEKPGLPDLLSFARLCYRFDSDANWMLGLTRSRYPLPKSQEGVDIQNSVVGADWVGALMEQIGERASCCEVRYMPGDDMEPRIKNGAAMWVDTATTEIQSNGVYLLEYQGRLLVRQVEIRIGEGLLLSCENARYKPTSIKDAASAKRVGLRIIGRIKLSVTTETF